MLSSLNRTNKHSISLTYNERRRKEIKDVRREHKREQKKHGKLLVQTASLLLHCNQLAAAIKNFKLCQQIVAGRQLLLFLSLYPSPFSYPPLLAVTVKWGRFAVNLLQLFILNFIVAEHKLISLVLSSCGLRRIFIGLFNCILNATGDKHHFRPSKYVINELLRDLMTI